MDRNEADSLLKNLLLTSGIAFGINDGAIPVNPLNLDTRYSQPSVAHFLAAETGGQFFSVKPKMYATALDDILVQVHFRYVLGFHPISIDGKTHQLTVNLKELAQRTNAFNAACVSHQVRASEEVTV